jgi:hypothetical protein
MQINGQPEAQGRTQVLWSLCKFLELYYGKDYKIKYKSKYLFLAPHRVLEGARISEGPWMLNFISFMVNPPPAHDLAALSPGNSLSNHQIVGWLGPTAGTDPSKEIKIHSFCRGSKSWSSSPHSSYSNDFRTVQNNYNRLT